MTLGPFTPCSYEVGDCRELLRQLPEIVDRKTAQRSLLQRITGGAA